MLTALRALQDAGVEYVRIRAMAMGVHGVVRATEDMDLLVRAERDNIKRLRAALRTAYKDDPNIDDIRADDLLGEYPAVRYCPPHGELYFDLITRLGEMDTFESVESEVIEVDGVRIRVATPAALHRLKRSAVRPIDWQDAATLRSTFGLEEED